MKSGLFVSHIGQRCGVYQFGRRVFDALTRGSRIKWQLLECDSADPALLVLESERPDIIVLNQHPATLEWARNVDWRSKGAVVFSIFHEAHQEAADRAEPDFYDFLLCPDPTLIPRSPVVVPVPRVTLDWEIDHAPSPPDVFTVGSFGFATPGKGFTRLCQFVNAEFEQARIRLNIPPHDKESLVAQDDFGSVFTSCKAAVTKPGIELVVTREFFDDHSLMEFLAGNSLNAFLYDHQTRRGISSCVDYALVSGRPLAITRSSMLRHLHGANPSICTEDFSLGAIAERDGCELAPFRAAYHPDNAGIAWEKAILRAMDRLCICRSVPDGRGFNKILDDRSREAYQNTLQLLQDHAPEMLARKIARANIQQAFALDAALRLLPQFQSARILAIGSFEDTAVATLKAMGHHIDEIDPNINGIDLEKFYCSSSARTTGYDLILCVSVLEHVREDELFIRMAADLLAPEGIAIFTVDFAETYKAGDRTPRADERFYTSTDISQRLMSVLPDCTLLDKPTWAEGNEDFQYEECQYGFAGWVFRKIDSTIAGLSHHGAIANPAWKELIWKADEQLYKLTDCINEMKSSEIGKLRDILINIIKSFGAQNHQPIPIDMHLNYNRLVYDYRINEAPHELKLALKLARLLRKISWKLNPSRKRKWLKKKIDAQAADQIYTSSTTPILTALPDYLDVALVTLSAYKNKRNNRSIMN